MKTLVIVPVYNEQDNILKTMQDLQKHCPEIDSLFINDCSTDGTAKLLSRSACRYIDLPINLGIGGGVQTGYIFARDHGYEAAVQFDGDGQHMAEYIHNLLEPIKDDTADYVVGSRFITKTGFQSTGMRRFGIAFLSRWIKMLSGITVHDVTSGMRAINRKYITMFASDYEVDYPEPEAILLAGLSGARIREIPVRMRERQAGKSSINTIKSAYYMIKVFLALLILRLSVRRETK